MSIGAHRRFSAALVAASVCALWIGSSGAASAQGARDIAYDIPPESLSQALRDYGRESGRQIVFTENLVRGRTSHGLKGSYSADAALARLLDGTDLVARLRPSGAILIERKPPAVTRRAAPSRPRANTAANDATPIMLSTIVVTALYRRQRLQDVPASVSVLQGSTLVAKGAEGYSDYLPTVPGVNFAQVGGLGANSIAIRGVSQGGASNNPLTAIYLDEAPITENYVGSLDPDVYDIERVEVLKGPQGTLYGASSMGGTIRIITNKPRLDRFAANADLLLGDVAHGGLSKQAEAMVNVPLVPDRMALRIAGGYRDEAGWIDDAALGIRNGNSVQKRDVHAQLLLQPGTRTRVLLSLLYQNEGDGLPAFRDLKVPDYETNRLYRGSGTNSAKLYSLTITQDWDWMSLTSATNYMRKDLFLAADTTAAIARLAPFVLGVTTGPAEGIGIGSTDDFTIFTQEVRLQSEGKNRLDWLLGSFFSNSTSDIGQEFDLARAPTLLSVTSNAGFYQAAQTYGLQQIAAFGQLTYNVFPGFSLSAGLRDSSYRVDNASQDSGLLNGGSSSTLQTTQKSALTQRYAAKYEVTRNSMVYAQASQGFRVGGPNSRVPQSACGPYLAQLGYSAAPDSYGPDRLWEYEVGSKNTLLDSRMSLNGAVYYIDWKDMQSLIGLNCGFSFTTNAGRAVSKGAEFDLSVRPLRGLTLAASGSYVDAAIADALRGSPEHVGDTLPLVSKWSGNFSAQYDHALSGSLDAFERVELNYIGGAWNTFPSQAGAALLSSYSTLALRVGISGRNWTASFFGTNLTDRHVVMWQSTTSPFYQLEARPREVGLELRVSR